MVMRHLLQVIGAIITCALADDMCCFTGCENKPNSCSESHTFCSDSQSQCEKGCSGTWCPSSGPTPPTPPTPPPTPPTPPPTPPKPPTPPPTPPTPPVPPTPPTPSPPEPPTHGTPLERYGRLGLQGTQLVDQKGEPIQLRGMSVFNPGDYDNCITQESIKFLASEWGISILRIPMSSEPQVYNQRMKYVDWARDAGIYAIVDYHLTGTTPVIDDTARNFWKTMATRFSNYTNVFYELFNEPADVDWTSTIKPYHEAMLNIIRPIDPHAIVLCGTQRWSQLLQNVVGHEVQPSSNVMYVLHVYAATHQFYDDVGKVLDKIPVFTSEWGVCDSTGSGNLDPNSAQTWVNLFAGKDHNPTGVKLSWVNWAYDDKDESCAALQPGACDAKSWDRVSQSGTDVKGYLKEQPAATKLATMVV